MRSRKRVKRSSKKRLLLDEGLPPKQRFPHLNNYYDVKHSKHDYRMNAKKDVEVYKRASKENRIIVTLNTKDFRPLLTPDMPTIIAVSTNMDDDHIDVKLSSVLSEMKSNDLKGKLYLISKNGVEIKSTAMKLRYAISDFDM